MLFKEKTIPNVNIQALAKATSMELVFQQTWLKTLKKDFVKRITCIEIFLCEIWPISLPDQFDAIFLFFLHILPEQQVAHK